ncbi:MAG: adenylate kinase [Sulfurospirillum sp.]
MAKFLFLIIGAPGSGKTTDAQIIADKNADTTAHFSTGELLRQEVKSGSNLGKIINKKISAGNLVPVKIAVETIVKAINSTDKKTVIIDGFPRSVEQMTELEKELKNSKNIKLKRVIEVEVSKETAKNRVLGRARGADDKEEIFNKRMEVYNEPLNEIRDFYGSKNLLVKVDGEREIEEIVEEMMELIYG